MVKMVQHRRHQRPRRRHDLCHGYVEISKYNPKIKTALRFSFSFSSFSLLMEGPLHVPLHFLHPLLSNALVFPESFFLKFRIFNFLFFSNPFSKKKKKKKKEGEWGGGKEKNKG